MVRVFFVKKTLAEKPQKGRNQNMSRIKLYDSIESTIMKMSEGNPGAITILLKMLKTPEAFEPAHPLMEILSLDTLGIYGSDIWDLGEYVCQRQNMDILRLISLNHSYGKLSQEVLHDHIKSRKPFEKLYTIEELEMDFSKNELPLIER